MPTEAKSDEKFKNNKDLDKISHLIKRISLPKIKNIQINQVLSFIQSDKKNILQTLNFILLEKIGKASISQDISYDDIKMVLRDNEYISY